MWNSQVSIIPLSLREPNSSISYPEHGSAALFAARVQPGTEGSSTAHPPNAGISQTGTRIPHQEHDAAQQDHHKSQGNDVRAWKHQLKMPRVQRGSSWGSDTGKLFPVTLPKVYFVRICTLEGNSGAGERSQCPADDGWDSLPLWEGQTRTDGAQDTVGMSQQTDLYLTAAAGTACGRKRGRQRSQPPKVHTAGKRRCFHSSGTAVRS